MNALGIRASTGRYVPSIYPPIGEPVRRQATQRNAMKKIGIVGGVAWLSTVHYYSEICRRSEREHLSRNLPGVAPTPEICIESLDLSKAVSYLGSDSDERSWARFDDYHRAALNRLEASGADFALMASNTPHHRFTAIVQGIQIPVVSILDAMAEESARIGAKEVLILGTPLTMKSPRFRDAFEKLGIKAAGPTSENARAMTVDLIAGLQQGKQDDAALRLGKIAKMTFEQQFTTQPVVCLACTELPLAFAGLTPLATFECDGITYINTAAAHINAAFNFALR